MLLFFHLFTLEEADRAKSKHEDTEFVSAVYCVWEFGDFNNLRSVCVQQLQVENMLKGTFGGYVSKNKLALSKKNN